MDKNVLKKFAIESRQELMEKVANKINRYFVDEEFNVNQNGEVYVLVNDKHTLRLTKNEYENRQLLVKRIKEITLEQVIEEAAYTWFNRIIAIRYMEIHDYLPLTKDNQSLGVRVLSSKDNTPDPEIMKISNLINSDLDIEFNKEYYGSIQDNNKRFEYILLLVCKKLGKVIPQVFDGITDYIDILVPDNLLNESGYVTKLLNDVAEENFKKVEIIGWLYQYYISEKKDEVFEKLKRNIKIEKNSIPAATQIFTPDWIVKYMVENTLGKYYTNSTMNYYEVKTNNTINKKYDLSKIKFLDPCCGSGHILVYAFEMFFQMYLESGYNKNQISELILTNNLFGIDIDDRASQLAILSVLLKAKEFDKNIFANPCIKNINIMSIQSTEGFENYETYFNDSNLKQQIYDIINDFKYAKDIGSLLKIKEKDYSKLNNAIIQDDSIFGIELKKNILPIIKLSDILQQKYEIVVTNPPYIGSKGLSDILRDYLADNYSDGKYDTYSSFILRCIELCSNDGYIGMMTPNTWMFINSYKNLRNRILDIDIDSLLHLSNKAFNDAAVIITSFILKKSLNPIKKSVFINLQDYDGDFIKSNFKNIIVSNSNVIDNNKFLKIPNNTFTYWLSDNFVKNLEAKERIKDEIISDGQTKTGNNDKYLRFIWEVDKDKIAPNKKWNIHAKGGEYRKWYGNLDTLIDWSDEAREFYKKDKVARITPEYLCFRKGITWTLLSGNNNSFRLLPEYCTFNCVGPSVFLKNDEHFNLLLGLLNSIVAKTYINGFNPTLSLTIGDISNVPLIYNNEKISIINKLVDDNIKLAKEDWDSFETSWDFIAHPLVRYKSGSGFDKDINKRNYKIKDAFEFWKSYCEEKFKSLKQNEEELNQIFIDLYGLQDELTFNVEDKDITLRKAERERDIKSLISYAVGCMFGRYSLNKEGLVYAGGKFESVFEKYKGQNLIDENGQPLPGNNGGWAGVSLADYKYFYDGEKEIELSYSPDIDNIIPLTEENYFGDDIVSRFKKFIEVTYGKETLYENLEFIAETLGKKNGENSEETIRRYFINDFYNDHVKMYQKRPIYWLFDSGKKNGFKCLIYMHRYSEGLVSKIRLDYLHRMQNTYEKELKEILDKLNDDVDLTIKRELSKRQADISAKLQETNEYDEKIAHIADQKIKIDLDDGVAVNYAKFSVKNPKTGKEESILANSKDIVKKKKDE